MADHPNDTPAKDREPRGCIAEFFLSVRFLLPFTVGMIVFAVALCTILLMALNTNDAVESVVDDLHLQILNLVSNRFGSHLNEVLTVNMASASRLARTGVATPASNTTSVLPTFNSLVELLDDKINNYPLIDVHYIFYTNGRVIAVLRNDNATNLYAEEFPPTGTYLYGYSKYNISSLPSIMVRPPVLHIEDYVGYQRPYFTSVDWSVPFDYAWTNPYVVGPFLLFTNTISIVDDNGNFLGVMGADSYITTLNNFLKDLKPTPRTKVFVVDPNEELVAATHGEVLDNGDRIKVTDSSDPTIAAAGKALGSWTNVQGLQRESFHVSGEKWLLAVQEFNQLRARLTMAVVTPEDEFLGPVKEATSATIGVCAAIAIAGIFIIVLICGLISRNLKRLGERMKKTASLQDSVDDDAPSLLTEVADMQTSYTVMRSELQKMKSFLPQAILQADRGRPESVATSSEYSFTGLDGISLKSVYDDEGCSGAVDGQRLRAAINHFTSQDCTIAVITVAYNAPLGTVSHSICVEVLLDAIIRGVSQHRGVVEQMKPHQVIVSFGARNKISNPANCALKFATALNAKVTIPEVEASVLLDRGTFFVGSCGNHDLREEVVTSPELDALLSLGPLVHTKHRVPIAATDRIAPSLTDHCAVFPIDNVQWGNKGRCVHLCRVVPITASLLAACDSRIFSRLKRGFGLMCNGNHEDALVELKEGQQLLQQPGNMNQLGPRKQSAIPEAAQALYAATSKAFDELMDAIKFLEDPSQAYARRYLGWPTLEGPGPLTAEFDPNRCEVLEEEHEAPLRLRNQLHQLTKLKENRVPQFKNPLTNNASANASGLFEMAFTIDIDAQASRSTGGSAPSSAFATYSEETCDTTPADPDPSSVALPKTKQYLRHWRRGEHILGRGAFGSVYRALNDNGSIAAMKILPLCTTTTDLDDLKKELVVTAGQRHENLVQFVDAEVGTEELVVIMELLPGGSLESLVNDFGVLPPRVVRRFVVDILRGLSHLHRVGIVHCDVKPQNVLVGVDGMAKVADFGSALHPGFAANHGEDEGGDLKIPGTPAYMAPEVARGGAPGPASDIWSFGVMLHELLARKRPFNDQQIHQMDGGAFKCIRVVGGIRDEGDGLQQPPHVELPLELEDREATEQFLQACLIVDPLRRATSEKLLTMEYLL